MTFRPDHYTFQTLKRDADAEIEAWRMRAECIACSKGTKQSSKNRPKGYCDRCSYCTVNYGVVLLRIYDWVKGSKSKVKAEFANAINAGSLGFLISDCNSKLDPSLAVNRVTLSNWFSGEHDPGNRGNDADTRLNLYRIFSILGISGRDTIAEVFGSVGGAEAFDRSDLFECCIEHMAVLGSANWLPEAIDLAKMAVEEYDRLVEGKVRLVDDDDAVAVSSVIFNRSLKQKEFARAIAYSRLSKGIGEANKKVMELAEEAKRNITELKYAGSRRRPDANQQVIAPILKGVRDDPHGNVARLPNANAVLTLKETGASVNFPTSKIYGKAANGTANDQMVRRLLLLFIFFNHYCFYSDDSFEARTAAHIRFVEACQEELKNCGLRGLDCRDGFDALLLFCTEAEDPLACFRRIISGEYEEAKPDDPPKKRTRQR